MTGTHAPVAVAGCGRAGGALVTALARAGVPVRVWSRDAARARRVARAAGASATPRLSELLTGAAVVLIAVRDDALATVADRIALAWPKRGGPRVALHTSGARPSGDIGALAAHGAALGVFHPVAPLFGPSSAPALAGAFVTVSGEPRAVSAARRLARALSLRPVAVDDRARALLHAALVLVAGDLVALLGTAEDVLRRAGIAPRAARAVTASLAAAAVAGYGRAGAARALTGPVVRGDAGTIARHLRNLAGAGRAGRDAAALHRGLVAAGVRQLLDAGTVSPAAARRVLAALDSAR